MIDRDRLRGTHEGRDSGQFVALISVGLALRLAIAPFAEDPSDLRLWRLCGERLLAGASPYCPDEALPFAYPPLWAGWCWAAAAIARDLSPEAWRLTLKLPLILADLALAGILWRAGRTAGAQAALLSPLLIAVSAYWGQFDVLPALLVTLAVLDEERPARAGLWYGLACGFKGFYPAFLGPWLAWRLGGRFAAAAAVALLAALAPALLLDPGGFIAVQAFHAARTPQGLTPWVYAPSWLLPLANWVLPAAIVLVTIALARRRCGTTAGCVALVATFLATSKVVNEQYLVWLFALLALDGRAREAWLASIAGAGAIFFHLAGCERFPDLYAMWPRVGVATWTAALFAAVNPSPAAPRSVSTRLASSSEGQQLS